MPENKKEKGKGDSLPKRTIKSAKVLEAEKRYKPTRHYVFIIQVTYTDDTEYVIYRRYSDFFDFHTCLLDQFPIEAGEFKEPRIIPYLPGRKVFTRKKKKLADERQRDLNDYCRELIGLKDSISGCRIVREFFEAKPTDLNPPKESREKPKKSSFARFFSRGSSTEKTEDGNLDDISGPMDLEPYKAIADYKAGDKTEISLTTNQIVDVLEKNDNGWWLVQIDTKQGWAPATYLEPIDQDEEIDDPEPIYGGEPFVSLDAHVAEADDELSFDRGVILDVLHKHLDGWWVASYNGNVGYIPASYVQPYNDRHLRPTESVIVRRKQNAKTKRKSVLNPNLPRTDLSIYKSMRQLVYDDVIEEEAPVNITGGYDMYVNNPYPVAIMPNRSCEEDETGAYYSDVEDGEGELYENMSDQPPIPPPKDYRPELPPKAISPPVVPPKQQNVSEQKKIKTRKPGQGQRQPGRNATSTPPVPKKPGREDRPVPPPRGGMR